MRWARHHLYIMHISHFSSPNETCVLPFLFICVLYISIRQIFTHLLFASSVKIYMIPPAPISAIMSSFMNFVIFVHACMHAARRYMHSTPRFRSLMNYRQEKIKVELYISILHRVIIKVHACI
jgi:hypothetical protein